mgnify:CR=1 FL=1
MDARIAAITGQMEVLEQAYEEQLELYVEAADAMRKTVENGRRNCWNGLPTKVWPDYWHRPRICRTS